MKIFLHISASPQSPFIDSAFEIASALLAQKHQISGIFFSGKAVKTFNKPADKWLDLAKLAAIKLLCCSAASSRYLGKEDLPQQIEIAGLGQLVSLSEEAERVLNFGSPS